MTNSFRIIPYPYPDDTTHAERCVALGHNGRQECTRKRVAYGSSKCPSSSLLSGNKTIYLRIGAGAYMPARRKGARLRPYFYIWIIFLRPLEIPVVAKRKITYKTTGAGLRPYIYIWIIFLRRSETPEGAKHKMKYKSIGAALRPLFHKENRLCARLSPPLNKTIYLRTGAGA